MSEERNEAIPNCKRIASFLYSDMMVLIYVHRPLLKKFNKSRVPGGLPGTLIYRYPPRSTIAFKIWWPKCTFLECLALVQAGEPVPIKSYDFAHIKHSIPATERTVYEIASIGKTLTAMLTMMLVDDGCIALDDTIVDYLENPPEAWKSVSLKHILCHKSGIPSYTDAENCWNITRLD